MAVIYLVGCILALVLASTSAEDPRKAIAVLSSEDNIRGIIVFSQQSEGGEVTVTGNITGLPQGEHGFHIHEKGNITQKCLGAGGHFNPENKDHGAPNSTVRHVGDLGNIYSNGTGPTLVEITDHIISLFGEHNIIGRAIVIHEKVDDLGLGNTTFSKTTGNAGDRLACGVIGIQSPVEPWFKGSGGSVAQSATSTLMSMLLVALLTYVAV